MRIIFIIPYPYNKAPSQRFRFEQYLNFLKERNFKYTISSFLDVEGWNWLYKKGSLLKKIYYLINGFWKRLIILLQIHNYHYIFIHREVTPFGPPWFEFLAAKILKKKIIYDFDDAIWLKDPDEKGTLLAKLKWKSKVASICRWSYKISAGNEYLANYAKQYNQNVNIIPTTIDTENYHNPEAYKKSARDLLTIGWTGTHSTLQYLNLILPVLKRLEQEAEFRFLVIANKNPHYNLRSFDFLEWKKDTEIKDLLKIDIGIMPLTDDEWSKGKCGFKVLQYMALKIPAVASPVGVNQMIINNGKNGYLCGDKQEFYNQLKELLNNKKLREEMGVNGRQKVEDEYSVEANKAAFLSLFK
ncbi:MAG: glycosyltransferase [Candidatus Cyclobacteriaceae bacterium M2_1C_046]